eukprot:gene47919-58704_t
MKKSTSLPKLKAKKKDVVDKEREDKWYIPPTKGIPKYDADSDPYCPAARVRKFNAEQKERIKAEVLSKSHSESYVQQALAYNYTEVELKKPHDFYGKAVGAGSGAGGMTDVEIIQKIIIRENLLKELNTIVKHANDIEKVMSEILELLT